MFDEPFTRGRSLIHALDPRIRLAAAFACAACLAVVRRPEAAGAGLVMAQSGFNIQQSLVILNLSRQGEVEVATCHI